MLIKRDLFDAIQSKIGKGKAIIVVGARQVGKTTLLVNIADSLHEKPLMLNCDDPETRLLLEEPTAQELKLLIGNNKTVLIDEAQRVKGIGLTLKRIADGFKDVQLLVTGSSSLQLHDLLNEPLTGRKYEYILYPIATQELLSMPKGLLEVKGNLKKRLIYGSYPEILASPEDISEKISSLADSYLYKDLLSMEGIRRPELLDKLLKALALQLGSEVSYNELARTVGSDPKTVEKYIDLLEKCFVVFRLSALSRNMRTELKKSRKVYFWDNGIRNAVINNFSPVELRSDMGALWENFFVTERIKYNAYRGYRASYYFWRTTTQQEIDLIEEKDGEFTAFEMKWNSKKKSYQVPPSFTANYKVAATHIVTPENYMEFVCNLVR